MSLMSPAPLPPTWSIKNSAPPLWPTPSAAPPPQGKLGAILITADAIISQGIAEAFISGIPLLIIAGGPLANTPTNGIDQQQLLQPVSKACFKITRLEDIVSTIFEAQQIAISHKPGPVFVEIPLDLQLHTEDVDEPLPVHLSAANQPELDQHQDRRHSSAPVKCSAPPACYWAGMRRPGPHRPCRSGRASSRPRLHQPAGQ